MQISPKGWLLHSVWVSVHENIFLLLPLPMYRVVFLNKGSARLGWTMVAVVILMWNMEVCVIDREEL